MSEVGGWHLLWPNFPYEMSGEGRRGCLRTNCWSWLLLVVVSTFIGCCFFSLLLFSVHMNNIVCFVRVCVCAVSSTLVREKLCIKMIYYYYNGFARSLSKGIIPGMLVLMFHVHSVQQTTRSNTSSALLQWRLLHCSCWRSVAQAVSGSDYFSSGPGWWLRERIWFVCLSRLSVYIFTFCFC